MKSLKITWSIYLIVLLSACNHINKRKDLNELNLKGNVISVFELTFSKFSCLKADGGNKIIVQKGDYNVDDYRERRKWMFNKDGNVLFLSTIKPKSNSNKLEEYDYDILGRVKKYTVKDGINHSEIFSTTYNYQFMSNLCIDSKNNLNQQTFKYDDSGNMIEYTESEPKIHVIMKNTYNPKGLLTTVKETGLGNVYQTVYERDADGMLLSETKSLDGYEEIRKEYWEGKLAKVIKNDGSIVERYDENENVCIIEYFDPNTKKRFSKEIYQYEYDTQGNWIKRIKCTHYGRVLDPTELTIREIQY